MAEPGVVLDGGGTAERAPPPDPADRALAIWRVFEVKRGGAWEPPAGLVTVCDVVVVGMVGVS